MGGIEQIIQTLYLSLGYGGIVLAMALESACIPLPSEIVMPLAGFFVVTHPSMFSLLGVTVAGVVGGLIGSLVAYTVGATGGRPLLLRYGKFILISKRDSDRADRWFAKYGSSVAFFSRLLPVIRTYISLPAGIARMNLVKFIIFTVLGSVPWTFALALIGIKLGSKFGSLSSIFHYFDIFIVVLVVVGIGYYVYHHFKDDHSDSPKDSYKQESEVR